MPYSSIEDFCRLYGTSNTATTTPPWSDLPISSRQFLEKLQVSPYYPYCDDHLNEFYSVKDIPPMGPLEGGIPGDSILESMTTLFYMVVPQYVAFADLWLRLFSGVVAPAGLMFLVWEEQRILSKIPKRTKSVSDDAISCITILTSLAALCLMTDSLYVYEYGARYGATVFLMTVLLSIKVCQRHGLRKTLVCLILICLIAIELTWDGNAKRFQFGEATDVNVDIEPGLYYNHNNPLIEHAVSLWPEQKRTYSRENGATFWLYHGDARTGLPFFLNKVPEVKYTRVFLPVEDGEVLALDVAFPETGHDSSLPVYLILHGVNGGSTEEYAKDLVYRRTTAGSTVVVMVSRGLMDVPIRGWNIFHAARLTDAHQAATAVRRALSPGQTLGAVGYSMGAIVLSNYVASYGTECPLDAAFSISGALECRAEQHFARPKRLWQPMIAENIRSMQHLSKWGERVKARLSQRALIAMLRATDVVELDRYTAVAYNREFNDIPEYYAAMSALGDIPLEYLYQQSTAPPGAKINNVSIPLCVLHAFDDPISTWRTNAANEGLMRPENLVRSGKGNLLLLLTRTGGHVGWPVGIVSYRQNWEFMNDAAATFIEAVAAVKSNISVRET